MRVHVLSLKFLVKLIVFTWSKPFSDKKRLYSICFYLIEIFTVNRDAVCIRPPTLRSPYSTTNGSTDKICDDTCTEPSSKPFISSEKTTFWTCFRINVSAEFSYLICRWFDISKSFYLVNCLWILEPITKLSLFFQMMNAVQAISR